MDKSLDELLKNFIEDKTNKDAIKAIINKIIMQKQSREKVQDSEEWKRFMLNVLDNCDDNKGHTNLIKKIIDFVKDFSNPSANNEGNKTIYFEVLGKCLNNELKIDDTDKIDYLCYAVEYNQLESALNLLVEDLIKNRNNSSDLLCKYVDKLIEHKSGDKAMKAGKKLFDKLNNFKWEFPFYFAFCHPRKVNKVINFSKECDKN